MQKRACLKQFQRTATCQPVWTVHSEAVGSPYCGGPPMADKGTLYFINLEVWNSFGQGTDKMRKTFLVNYLVNWENYIKWSIRDRTIKSR